MRKTEEMPCGFDVKKCYLCDAEKVILKPYQKMEKKKKTVHEDQYSQLDYFIFLFFSLFVFVEQEITSDETRHIWCIF